MSEPKHDELSDEKPKEEEYEILNGPGGCLEQFSENFSAINLAKVLDDGHHLDWTTKEVDGQGVLVPCIKDKTGNIVEHKMQKRQYPGASHMIKFILPFCNVQTWALTPDNILKSSARLNDEPSDSVLKETARQEFAVRGAPSADGDGSVPIMEKIYEEFLAFASTRAAAALIASKHPDFSHFKGSVENLAENILDRDWSKIYAWIKPARVTTDDSGTERTIKEISCRSNMFQGRKQASANMDPMQSAPHEFKEYSEEDKERVKTVLRNADGKRKFTPINIVLADGTQGSSATLRTNCVGALVMGVGNINFGGRGGGVFVRKAFDLIIYRNGPQRTDDAPAFNASSFVADMMKKKKRGREDEGPIKADSKSSKKARFEDVKKKLAARKKALKSAETVDSE